MSYRITTESTCDMPWDFYANNGVTVLGLKYTLADGREFTEGSEDSLTIPEFYQYLREGGSASTTQLNAYDFAEAVEPFLAAGEDILHVGFSGGLSGTVNSCRQAIDDLKEKYPERSVIVVDSLCASMGEGLLLTYAIRNRDAGMSLQENAAWLDENKWNIAHWFTVDDLMFLHRGGRVSKSSAVLGGLIGIKPILHVDDEGHLVMVAKKRGRKAAVVELADRLQEGLQGEMSQPIYISHGDCAADAEALAELLRERGATNIACAPIGTVIGSHSGPGTLALFFLTDKR